MCVVLNEFCGNGKIVGVCAAMKVLDGDDVRLSAKGRYAERDIVQVSCVYLGC